MFDQVEAYLKQVNQTKASESADSVFWGMEVYKSECLVGY